MLMPRNRCGPDIIMIIEIQDKISNNPFITRNYDGSGQRAVKSTTDIELPMRGTPVTLITD